MALNYRSDLGSLPEKFDFSHGWMRWGAVGLIAFTLAAITSLRPLRNAVFEFFLISHIVLIGYVHVFETQYFSLNTPQDLLDRRVPPYPPPWVSTSSIDA